MNNLIFNLRKFIANKNTVTFIGVILIVLILYIGYTWRVNQQLTEYQIPYAVKKIEPRTKITSNMIATAKIPANLVKGKIIRTATNVVGKWTKVNTIIPEGSVFYQDTIVDEKELPNAAFLEIPSGYTAFNLPADISSTYGNSFLPGDYIHIYLKALDTDGKIVIGKLVENVKVLAVKDKSGRHVFENADEDRTPSSIILAVSEEMHLLLRKALYLKNVDYIQAEIIPVPNTASTTGTELKTNITSQYLKEYIVSNTGYIPEEELPTGTETTE